MCMCVCDIRRCCSGRRDTAMPSGERAPRYRHHHICALLFQSLTHPSHDLTDVRWSFSSSRVNWLRLFTTSTTRCTCWACVTSACWMLATSPASSASRHTKCSAWRYSTGLCRSPWTELSTQTAGCVLLCHPFLPGQSSRIGVGFTRQSQLVSACGCLCRLLGIT